MAGTDSWGLIPARIPATRVSGPVRRSLTLLNLNSVLQLVEPVHGHNLTRLKALHRRVIAIVRARSDVLHRRSIVGLDHVDERLLSIALNGRSRNQDNAVLRLNQELRIHELIREKVAVLVVENRL